MIQELEDEGTRAMLHQQAADAKREHLLRQRAIRFVVFVAVVVILISLGVGIR